MSLLKKIILVIGGILLTAIFLAFLLPSHYKVERAITISATKDEIFPYIANLKNWENWGVWFKRDPNISLQYSCDIGKVGMKSHWTSGTLGNGEITIIALENNRRLIYNLSLENAYMITTGEFILIDTANGTKVIWKDYGEAGLNPIDRYIAFFMDFIVGSDFELGLENLKLVAEAS